MAHFEQAPDLLSLPAIHINEELYALESGDGVARRRAGWRWRLTAGLAGGHGAALQQIKHSVLEGPFNIAPRAVHLFALQRELVQGGELNIIDAKLVHLLGRDFLLESAAVRQRADGDALAAGFAFEHLTGAIEAEVLGHDKTGNDRFTEPPTGFGHALISAGYRVLRKHHPGRGRVEECLHDHADARPGEHTDTLAVSDGRI